MRMLATSVLALLLATIPVQADPGDYLEIYPKQLRVSGFDAPVTVKEGQAILLHCDWAVAPSDADRQWYAGGREHRFSVRILVDEQVIGSFEGVLGPRTRIGNSDGSRGFSVNGTSGPLSWTASSPGDHKAVCIVNEPKTVSDRWPQNNTSEPVMIRVTPKSPPKKGHLKRPPRRSPMATASVFVIEAENLISTAVASSGQMFRQDMDEFGSGWGGNAQLFWRPPASGDTDPHLLSVFELPSAGTYELVLYYTVAPDYGQFTVFVDGRKVARVDGYGPDVALDRTLLGRYPLAAGPHELAFEVSGKRQRSTGYIVGIDRLHFTLAGE